MLVLLVAVLAQALLVVGGCAALVRLRDLSANVDRLGNQLDATKASYDQHVDSLTLRMGAVESASGKAEQSGRSLSHQITELNRLLVDQAVILVEVREGMDKGQSAPPADQPAAGPSRDGQNR